MSEALNEAMKALETKNWPVGCVIVLDGKVVSRGYNQVYSSTNKIMHAEIMAMMKIASLLSEYGNKADLYVTYEPCPMCFGAALLNHFRRIVYGTDIDGSGGLNLRDHLNYRFKEDKYKIDITSGVLESKCREVFLQGDPVKKLPQFSELIRNV